MQRTSTRTPQRPHRSRNTPTLLDSLESRLLLTAFPGAVGYGANATGGAGGSYYHVTNLNDSGAGSFRDAVSASNRIIVFDVAGIIDLSSDVSVKSNLTILGQSAPGQGISIDSREVSFDAASNDIVEYLRFRQGTNDPDSSKSGINLLNANNMIFNHVSIEFAQYDNIDAVGANNITIQNSIIADPIGQQFNAHTETLGGNFTWYNDIFANAHNRSPLAKVNTQMINCVVYNYQAGLTAANTGSTFSWDVVDNYFIAGPSTTSAGNDYYQVDSNISAYAKGNMLDSNKDGALNGSSANTIGGAKVLSSPYSSLTASIPTTSATAAYNYDIASAGDSLQRDAVDSQVIADITSLGTSGHLWTTQTSTGLTNNGYGTIATSPSSHPVLDGTYTLTNLHSQLALDDPANSKTAGTQMIQYGLSGATNQQWHFTYKGGGYYTITNVSSGLLLSSKSSSSALIQDTANGSDAELWKLVAVNGGYVIQNKLTGLVIDDTGNSTAPNNPIDLYTQTNNDNQVWYLGTP